nr:MAG: putative capsid protein [Cynopterus sphinx circular DNA virus 3]
MAYARKTYKKANKRKASPWYNKRYSAKDLALQALQQAKMLRGIINSEKHVQDTNHVSNAQNFIFRLVNITQGSNSDNRQGNSILLKSIYIRGQIEINPVVTGNTRYTLAIVRDEQQIADTTPSLGDIWQDATDSESMLNKTTAGRFKVIWRTTRYLTPSSGGKPVALIDKFVKLNNHIRFNGTTAADLQKGGYYLCLLTSEGVNFPTLNVQARLSFYDN